MSTFADLALVRRSALTALNSSPDSSSVDNLVEIIADTERQIADAPLESVEDFVSASAVLAEMVLAGPATDDRDVTLARNLLAAVERLTGAEAGASA